MKEVILTVGLPRSGKTTWARKQNCPVVNPDSIRLALHGMRFVPEAEEFVWAINYLMIRALLLAGHDKVIVDATNTTLKRRSPYIKKFSDCLVGVHLVNTSKEVCIERAKAENDTTIIPIIERMAEQFENVDEFTCSG